MTSRRAVIAGGGAMLAALGYAAWDSGMFSGPEPRKTHRPRPAGAAVLPFPPRTVIAKDGTHLRAGVFEAAAPGKVCVLLSGRGEFIEKYVEVIGELQARGYTVASFDWRGQGGSARPLADPLKAYVRDFSAYDDDLASFLEQIVRPIAPRPPLVLAHSMGGHVLLRALHARPGLFRAAALSAPMLGLQTRGYPLWMVRSVPAIYETFGQSHDYAWGMAKQDPLDIDFEHQLCTGHRGRYARTQQIIADRPSLRQGGATWGWITAAYRSMAEVTAPGYAEAITTPILFAGAGHDRIARAEVGRSFAKRLPHCSYVELKDAEHEILMERDFIRAQFWKAFDGFDARTQA
jgi:lysophospholipase